MIPDIFRWAWVSWESLDYIPSEIILFINKVVRQLPVEKHNSHHMYLYMSSLTSITYLFSPSELPMQLCWSNQNEDSWITGSLYTLTCLWDHKYDYRRLIRTTWRKYYASAGQDMMVINYKITSDFEEVTVDAMLNLLFVPLKNCIA